MDKFEVGQLWFVKIPDTSLGAEAVVKIVIMDMTAKTVLVSWVNTDTWTEGGETPKTFQGRFCIEDIVWVERISV